MSNQHRKMKATLKFPKEGYWIFPLGSTKPLSGAKKFIGHLPADREMKRWWKKWPEIQAVLVISNAADAAVLFSKIDF